MSRKKDSPAAKMDALILDMLDEQRPIGRRVVLNAKADREDALLVRRRLEALIEDGRVVVVRGDRLVKAGR